jgi:alcohol dehydrogenase class IV
MSHQLIVSKLSFGMKGFDIIEKYKNGTILLIKNNSDTDNRVADLLLKLNNGDSKIFVIGGGTIIDFSKRIRKEIEDSTKNQIEFYVIPSRIGSGAESSWASIVNYNQEKNIKVHNRFLPSGVIYYSKLYHSLSHLDLLEGSIDAIAHCIESTMSFNKNSYLDFLSTQTIEYIVKAQLIDKLIDNKIDKESDLINMSILSFNGGIAQNNAGSGICHALAHTAETVTGLGHAKCIAYFFNPVIRYLQLSNEEFNSKFNTQIIQLLCKIPEKLKSFNCFTELDKIIKNKENLPKFIDKAKNDPCWRLYRNKIDGELLMKQLLR